MQHAYPLKFDTHACVKDFIAVGFSEQQAEVQTGKIAQLADSFSEFIENDIATKQDIKNLRAATKQDIEILRAATKKDIENLRAETKQDIEKIRLEIENLRVATKKDIENLRITLKKDIEAMGMKLTIRLGGMLVVGITAIAVLDKIL